MAFKNLIGSNGRPEQRTESTSKAAMPVPRTVAPATAIDAGTTMSGKLRCKDTIRIDGRVKGEVRCDKTAIIGEGASVEASIRAESVIIRGEVKGDIVARRKVTLENTARVTGDLATPGIVIEEGATLEGRIVISPDEKPAAQKQAPARASNTTRAPAAATSAARSATPPSS
jgi:cytoskeletal protein CcmA (bactofilin family)